MNVATQTRIVNKIVTQPDGTRTVSSYEVPNEPQPATVEGEGPLFCDECGWAIDEEGNNHKAGCADAQPTTPHTATSIGNLLDIVSFAENSSDRAKAKAEIIATHAALVEALAEARLEIARVNIAAGETVFNPAVTSLIEAALAGK